MRQDRRKLILDAAEKLFLKKGYANTSIGDVSRLAGIPLGNMYYYHKTKLSMLTDILIRNSEDIQKVLDIFESDEVTDNLRLARLAAEMRDLNESGEQAL